MRKQLIEFEEALNRIGAIDFLPGRTPVEDRPLEEATGCVLAEPVTAVISSPPFTNSAMDGFAYRHPGTGGVIRLPIAGTVYAADHIECTGQDHAHRIMTGAPLPACSDSVVKVEDCTEPEKGMVEFELPAITGLNVRKEGEDLTVGRLLYEKGTILDSPTLLVLASQGFSTIKIIPPPRVGIISTGSEITEPGQPLKPGMIYNSSQVFLKSEIKRLGLWLAFCQKIPDDKDLTRRIAENADADIVISTGGISMGEKDYIPGELDETGYHILFHGVAMRPGQPNLLAKKEGGACWLGLPGNTIATMIGFRFLFLPLVRRYYGLEHREKGRSATLTTEAPSLRGKTRFYRGVLKEDANGETRVTLDRFQSSYAVSPTIRSNCFLRLDKEGSRTGQAFGFVGNL